MVEKAQRIHAQTISKRNHSFTDPYPYFEKHVFLGLKSQIVEIVS